MPPKSLAAALRQLADEAERTVAAVPAERPNARKLTPSEVRQLRTEYRRGAMNQRELASTYDLNPATVSRIVRGVYHADIR